jgi:hypothetical protein
MLAISIPSKKRNAPLVEDPSSNERSAAMLLIEAVPEHGGRAKD